MTNTTQARYRSYARITSHVMQCFLLSVAFTLSAAPGEFYVAPGGNNQWSGSRPKPNSAKTDGPFASIGRAVEATREWRRGAKSSRERQPTIFIEGGLYQLTVPVILGPEDSGLTLEAYQKQTPVLSGGQLITGWRPDNREGKKLWAVQVPNIGDGPRIFRELWIHNRRAVRARYPDRGYLKVAAVLDPAPDWTKGQARFRYSPNDLKAWKTAQEAEVLVMNRWSDSRLPISGIDENEHIIRFGKRTVFALEQGDLYFVEGAFEALDQPDEWYFERKSGTLYYIPNQGETLESFEAVAPLLPQVLRFEGKPEQDQFVERVTLRGLTFSHTEWCFPEGFAQSPNGPKISPEPEAEVGGFGQAEIGVPGAVWGKGLKNCVIERCVFRNLGTYGLELTSGCESNRVIGCDFSDLGAGGIKLGETSIRERSSEQTKANEISDCDIRDGGHIFPSAIGVWIGQSQSNQLLHNLIHDFYYTGISVGWTWGYGPSAASNNIIAYNHVHHIGIKSDGDGPILSDMGGIYTLGKQPGTQIVNNLWHDSAGLRYGGWGIYLDEGSSGILVTSNLVYRTTHGGFHQHYGETNSLWNNIFAFGRDQQLQRTRVEPHISFSFATNIVYFEQGALLAGDWSKDKYEQDWNVYWDSRWIGNPQQARFAGVTMEEWHARGHDTHSLIADPLFTAPDKGDFGLRSKSPALQMGFKPIDLSSVGIRSHRSDR